LACLGAALGWWRWAALSRSQRHLAAFLGASGLLGLLSAALRIGGFENAWAGNLWKLAVPVLLFPALVFALPARSRLVYWVIHRLAIIAWLIYFMLLGNLFKFTTAYHACICVATVLLSLTVLYECYFHASNSPKNASFIVAIVCAVVFTCDILPHSAHIGWLSRSGQDPMLLWLFRNAIWCAGYATMAYSLTIEEK
jgi:hypothetical protein